MTSTLKKKQRIERHRQTGCVGKVKYMTEGSALLKANNLSAKVGDRKGAMFSNRAAYKCIFCGFFHQTSR